MRRETVTWGILVFALVLSTTSLAGAAEGRRTPAELSFGKQPAAEAPTAPVARTLFVRVPGKAGVAERPLEVRVLFDGKPYLTEKIAVPPSHQAMDIELLARDAKAFERLAGLADRGVGQISFAVFLDGKLLRETTFQDLESASARLRGGDDFHPVPAESKVELLVAEPPVPDFLQPAVNKGYVPDPQCEQQCNDTYITCYYEICDQRGDCSYCWDDYEWCAAQCPQICVDPKKVYEFTTTQLLSITTYYSTCYELPNQSDYQWGEWFDYRRYSWKQTRIRRTEYCNGTYSDEVLSVTYPNTYCQYRTYLTCLSPFTRVNSWEICY